MGLSPAMRISRKIIFLPLLSAASETSRTCEKPPMRENRGTGPERTVPLIEIVVPAIDETGSGGTVRKCAEQKPRTAMRTTPEIDKGRRLFQATAFLEKNGRSSADNRRLVTGKKRYT
ncbi:MAG: hypothetical protein HQL09_03395 [Nitrospirae bacterium]|nr:hypothetical protein [Nitrospirota bacterium]